mmetsp:Transcript_108476/g.317365  ORF Transcript_108476/g.317365 Transcript_108476/m.317365 type:complete len:344 (+) Transcript_108476:45-1076(+)
MAAGAKHRLLPLRRLRAYAVAAAACLLAALCGEGWAGEALTLRRLRGTPDVEAQADEEPEPESYAPPMGQLVELEQVENQPWRMVKLLVPICPMVAKWWTEDNIKITVWIDRRITGRPQIHLNITGDAVDDRPAPCVQATVMLPEGAVVKDLVMRWVVVTAKFPPYSHVGPMRALVVDCPVSPPAGSPMRTARRHPLRWFLWPWLLLLLPFLAGSSVGPVALLAGACLTLASIACLSFVIAVLIVVVQRRCVLCTRRWRRLWRFRSLARRCSRIGEAFGDAGPCCICLAEADEREKLIALLPCRHAMHEECYSSWVRADSYPSHDLICPLCRRRADAIGKLFP